MSFDLLSTAINFGKTYYHPKFVTNAIDEVASKAYRTVAKDNSGTGKECNFLCDVDGGVPAGSATLSQANDTATNSTATIGAQFSVPWTKDYLPFAVDGLTLSNTKSDKGAFVNALKYNMDRALKYAAHRASISFQGEGWGELSDRAGIVYSSGATFKFADPAHIYRIMKGMPLQFCQTLDSGALRSSTVSTVTDIDYSGNVVTLDANPPSVANADTVVIAGDRQNVSSPVRLRPIGYPGWIPDRSTGSVPASLVTLGSVSRASNSLLYGHYVDGTGQSILDALMQAVQTVASIGNADDVVIAVSPANYTEAAKSINGDRRFLDVKGQGVAGFRAIQVLSDGGEGKMFADKYCSSDRAFVWQPKAFTEISCNGPSPRLDTDDGRQFVRMSDEDAIIGRFKSYLAMVCLNPNACAFVKLPN